MTILGRLSMERAKTLENNQAIFSSLQLNKHRQDFLFWMGNITKIEKYGMHELIIVQNVELFKQVVKLTHINCYMLYEGTNVG